jgi:DNA recombination protein RmuC
MTTTILFIIIGALVFAIVFILARKGGSSTPANNDTSFQLLLQQMNELSRTVDAKLSESQKITTETIRHQTNQSHNIIREVTEHLTELKESNKQVMSFTDQLQSLQDILKNPKQRGILGEYYLETLLKNILPPGSYQMQYAFADGDIVDVVVFVKDKIIPIDSKFSLENYNRISETSDPAEKERLEKIFLNDLKNRITETSKYIKPGAGTMEFAFMFIPHEAIYYDLIVNKIGVVQGEDTESLIQRAASKYKVIIVSPTSFLAYLQTVLQGLKAMQIEESAKDIIKRVGELSKHLKTYEEYQNKLGSSINTVVNHYNNSSKEFKKVDKDVMRITGESIDIQYIEASKIDEE